MCKFSDCDKLPTSWTGVTTDITFPIMFGTEVPVRCSDGYSKTRGDDEVTCEGDENYKYSDVPVCLRGLTIFIVIILIYNYIANNINQLWIWST